MQKIVIIALLVILLLISSAILVLVVPTKTHDMSFYVNLFNDRNSSNFSIQYEHPFYLNGRWEVGVSEIGFVNAIEYDLGTVRIFNADNTSRDVAINAFEGEPYSNFVERINKRLSRSALVLKKKILHFDFDPITKYMFIGEKLVEVFNMPGIFENTTYVGEELNKKFNLVLPDKIKFSQLIYIYSNVGENQYVNSSRMNLLKVVNLTANAGDYVYVNYPRVDYVPVRERLLKNIDILMRDSENKEIHFQHLFTRVFIKLHFIKK